MTTPQTKAGRALHDSRHEPENALCGDCALNRTIAAIEAEAAAHHLAEVRERVKGLIEAAGGRCVKPDGYDPNELAVCEAHGELFFEGGCEDQPRALLAVLALLQGDGSLTLPAYEVHQATGTSTPFGVDLTERIEALPAVSVPLGGPWGDTAQPLVDRAAVLDALAAVRARIEAMDCVECGGPCDEDPAGSHVVRGAVLALLSGDES